MPHAVPEHVLAHPLFADTGANPSMRAAFPESLLQKSNESRNDPDPYWQFTD